MNAQFIEGLKAVRDGINLMLSSIENDTPTTDTPTAKGVVAETAPVAEPTVTTAHTEEVSTPVADTHTANNGITREQLDGMTYNSIKKLAKERGVSAVGSREDIAARILGESAESPSSEKTTDSMAGASSKKANSKAKSKPEPETVEVDESDNDPIYAKVVESVADMSNEEIADVLADVGVSAKGKREALIEKVVQAVRDGLLDFDDDEDSEETPAETPAKKTENTKTSAPSEEEDDDDEDITNDINNPDMTEARRNAILAQDASIRKQFKKGEVTRDNLVEFLQSFYDTDEDMDDMSDDDLLDTYIDAVCRLVDDDGDLVEEGAYMMNGEPSCCGRNLKYSEDTHMFICEHCGEEYEAE